MNNTDLLSPANLMSLGLFVFGMDTANYDAFTQRIAWRHDEAERFMERAASQYVGPGDDVVSLSGRIIPGIAGKYSAIDTLIEMGGTGEHWLLMNAVGRVLGFYRIERIEQVYADIMAGGIPRSIGFTLDLKRGTAPSATFTFNPGSVS
jgi:phage protein U